MSLLESLETVAQGMQSRKGKDQFQAAIAALRRGDSLGQALEAHVPGFPDYLYAMARVGEASGRVAEVLKQAAEQMAYEDRLRKDFGNAMTYPAFLLLAGLGVVHALLARSSNRTVALVATYAFLFVFGWPLVIVALLGAAEPWLNLRRRFGGSGT